MRVMIWKVLIGLWLVVPMAQRGGGGGGGGAPQGGPTDPTPFEQFVDKFHLDERRQLPEVQKLFVAAAMAGEAISKEMMPLRVRMVELDGKPEELRPVVAAYGTQAQKMAALEARTFEQVYAILKDGQKSK